MTEKYRPRLHYEFCTRLTNVDVEVLYAIADLVDLSYEQSREAYEESTRPGGGWAGREKPRALLEFESLWHWTEPDPTGLSEKQAMAMYVRAIRDYGWTCRRRLEEHDKVMSQLRQAAISELAAMYRDMDANVLMKPCGIQEIGAWAQQDVEQAEKQHSLLDSEGDFVVKLSGSLTRNGDPCTRTLSAHKAELDRIADPPKRIGPPPKRVFVDRRKKHNDRRKNTRNPAPGTIQRTWDTLWEVLIALMPIFVLSAAFFIALKMFKSNDAELPPALDPGPHKQRQQYEY